MIDYDKIKEYINNNQPEFYWNYNDELSVEQINALISNEDGMNNLIDNIYENSIDYICTLENNLIEEIIEEFAITFKTDDEENDFYYFCKDYISVDLNINELINRKKIILFYETGYTIEETYLLSKKEVKQELKKIKKALKIPQKETIHDNALLQVLYQASYGGSLVIYFYAYLSDIIAQIDRNTLSFANMNIAIIDTVNGSGDNTFLKRNKYVHFPLSRNKIFYENSIHYNYSFDVCGMIGDWCESTQFMFSNRKRKDTVTEISRLKKLQNIDNEYQKTYDKGGCTFGDIDINRHRDTYYKNQYPCGTHCPHCGQFWID